MTDSKPTEEEMIQQTRDALAESVRPVADMIAVNTIAGELRAAYERAIDRVTSYAEYETHGKPWTPPKPLVIGTVVPDVKAIESDD